MKRSARVEAAPGDAARVGEEIRDARIALGWTVDEVADRLRINRRYIAALEEGRARDLPGQAYALGFVRTYARALGLDADDLVRRFRDHAGSGPRSKTDLVFPEPVPERGVPPFAIVVLGLVLVVGVYAGVWLWNGPGDRAVDVVPPVPPGLTAAGNEPATPPDPAGRAVAAAPATPAAPPSLPAAGPAPARLPASEPVRGAAAPQTPPAPAPTPASSPSPAPPPQAQQPAPAGAVVTLPGAAIALPAAPTPPAPPPGPPNAASPPAAPAGPRVVLRATDESWVQVRDSRSGEVLLNRVLRAGDTWPAPARDGLLMTTGRAQALEILLDGQASAGWGGRAGVQRDIALDPERLQAARPATR